ncbi:hypothetical protein [Bacillus salacetis]|nr:hypothetical protein [Bacillus salacetis]
MLIFVPVLFIMITLFSIEVTLRKTAKQNEEMIELLKGLQDMQEKE